MKSLLVFMLLFSLAMACIGCSTAPQRPTTPDHGTLGVQVPAPSGWNDYIKRGGE